MSFREHFRDLQEWRNTTVSGEDIGTSSDEAVRMYDAALTQLVGWYNDECLGGLKGTIDRMLEADENFILGRAMAIEVELLGGINSPKFNPDLDAKIQDFYSMVESKAPVSGQEGYHYHIVKELADNNLKKAIQQLEKLISRYPEDILGLKMIQDLNFFLGSAMPMRNSLAFSLAKIPDENPLKGYVHGMYSFALEESNMYPQAQEQALKALDLNPRDTWAIHNYAHCLEMQGKICEGLDWMANRRADWEPCGVLACHQWWHTALFLINDNQFEEAVDICDNEVLPRCISDSAVLNLHDAASMIYRMELVDLYSKANSSNNQERWKGVYEICKPHKRDHLNGFNNAHYMMTFLGMDDQESAEELIDSLTPDLEAENEGLRVGKPLLEAMYNFKAGDYAKCVDLLEPIRFEINKIGGSHAQRDVFDQLLLVAARKSEKQDHNALGERMLVEREAFHGSRLTQTELLAQA